MAAASGLTGMLFCTALNFGNTAPSGTAPLSFTSSLN